MDPSKDTPIMSSTTTNSTNIDNYSNLKKLNIKFTATVLTIIFSFTAIVLAYVCGFGDGNRKPVEFYFGDIVVLPVVTGKIDKGVVVGVGQSNDVLIVRIDNGVGAVPRYSEVRFVKSELSKGY